MRTSYSKTKYTSMFELASSSSLSNEVIRHELYKLCPYLLQTACMKTVHPSAFLAVSSCSRCGWIREFSHNNLRMASAFARLSFSSSLTAGMLWGPNSAGGVGPAWKKRAENRKHFFKEIVFINLWTKNPFLVESTIISTKMAPQKAKNLA